MVAWWWVLACVALTPHIVRGDADGVKIVQSKGIQVEALPHVLIATDLIQINLTANLPSMTVIQYSDTVTCKDIKSNKEICQVIEGLHETSIQIIRELSQIFTKLGPVATRQRRSLLPFLGKIRHFVEGTVTDDMLNAVIENLNNLGNDVNAIRNKTKDLISVTNTHAVQIQGLSKSMQEMMSQYTKAYNVLVESLNESQSDGDIVFHKLLLTIQLQSMIQMLQSHLLAMKSVYYSCQANILDRLAVSEGELKRILNQKNILLNAGDLKLAIPHDKIDLYYLLKTAQCNLISQTSLAITLNIPITTAGNKWTVFAIKPLYFLLNSQTCSVLDKTVLIASDGESIRPLDGDDILNNKFVKIIPRVSENSGLTNCIHRILTAMEVSDLQNHCHISCNDIKESTVQSIWNDTFSVLNPTSDLDVICHNVVVRTVKALVSGRNEIVLPCHCTLIEQNAGSRSLIPSGSACFLPQGTTAHVKVDNSWSDMGNFSLLEVFVPRSHALALLADNVTLPPIELATVAPFGNTGPAWKQLPLYKSGWVETILFMLICFSAIAAICYWVDSKTGLISSLWNCGRSAIRRFAGSANVAAPQPQPENQDASQIELQELRQRAAARL